MAPEEKIDPEELRLARKTDLIQFLNFLSDTIKKEESGIVSEPVPESDTEIRPVPMIHLNEGPVPQLWALYPKKIKQWVLFTKTPKGFYNFSGRWATSKVPTPELHEVEDVEAKTKQWDEIFLREQQLLPAELRGRFRFGVTFDEIKDYHPKLRRLFSMTNATPAEILALRKNDAIKKWGAHPTDTASEAVQVDILTQRIRSLNRHLKNNRQDKDTMRALQRIIKRRKTLMIRLKKSDPHTYFSVLKDIKLKDLYHVWDFRMH